MVTGSAPIGSKTSADTKDFTAEDFKKAYEKASEPNSTFTFSAQGNAIKENWKSADDMFGLVDKDCNGKIEGDEQQSMSNLFHGEYEPGKVGTGLDPKTDKGTVDKLFQQYGVEQSITPEAQSSVVSIKTNDKSATQAKEALTEGAGAGSNPATDAGVTGVDPNAATGGKVATAAAAPVADVSKVATSEVTVQKGDGMSHVLQRQYPDLFPPKAKDWSNLPAAMAMASQFGANGSAIGANKNAKDGMGLKAGDKLALPSQEDFVKLMQAKSSDADFVKTTAAVGGQLAQSYPKQAAIFSGSAAPSSSTGTSSAPTANPGTPAAPTGTTTAPTGTPAAPTGTTTAPTGTTTAPKTIKTNADLDPAQFAPLTEPQALALMKIDTPEAKQVAFDASTITDENKAAIKARLEEKGRGELYKKFVSNELTGNIVQSHALTANRLERNDRDARAYALELYGMRHAKAAPNKINDMAFHIISAGTDYSGALQSTQMQKEEE